jgi:hypothetical protein
VTLLDESGTVVRGVLSATDGAFTLQAPAPGLYVVRSEALGQATAETPVDLGEPGPPLVLVSPPQAPDTRIPSARADAACRVPPETARRVAALWDEAGKVLRVVEWSSRSGLLTVESEIWFKSMEPRRLRVVDEARSPRPGFRPTGPLPSPPASELAEEGFIRGGGPGEPITFHGPDAATLLSDAFAATHCLGFADSGPEDGWVGLTFAPLDPEAREVEGTLWLDAGTGEPTRLEYRYTALPWPVKTDKAGGGCDFQRLPGGAWIVGRWWLRMPRVGVREERLTQWDPPRKRYTLTSLVEEGGEVTRVKWADGRIEVLTPEAP